MKDILLIMKVKTVIKILKSDPNIKEVYYDAEGNAEQVHFSTHDKTSDESENTGYFSTEGYNWDEFIGINAKTVQKLKILGYDYQFNDCESFENEGTVFLTNSY